MFFKANDCICIDGWTGPTCNQEIDKLPLVVVFDTARKSDRFTNVWNTGTLGVDKSHQISLFDVRTSQIGELGEYSPGGTMGTLNKEQDDKLITGNVPRKRTYWLYEENQDQTEKILAKPLAFDNLEISDPC